MNSRRRIDDFEGPDSDYIVYLESKVDSLTATASPPSPPHSEVRANTITESDGDDAPVTNLKFFEYDPHPDKHAISAYIPPSKRQRKQIRWEREMDEMLGDIPTAVDWTSKREKVGLSSSASILTALDVIIHGGKSPAEQPAGEAVLSVVSRGPSNTIQQLLNNFATRTATLKTEVKFTTQICHFRVFVFVSLCCVALHHGVDRSLVEKIMSKCVSDSSGKHLTRLRSGALWVNRMMRTLAADGFGHLAYELFVLAGRPIAQYGRFAYAGDRAFTRFKDCVPKCKPGIEIQASLPFWVPFIIKRIVGEIYSLQDICTALGYDMGSQAHDCPQYLRNYSSRQLPLPNIDTGYPSPFTDHSHDASARFGGDEAGQGKVPADDGDLIQALLTAARQIDEYPRLSFNFMDDPAALPVASEGLSFDFDFMDDPAALPGASQGLSFDFDFLDDPAALLIPEGSPSATAVSYCT